MELEGSMHHGRVLIALSLVKQIREIGMQALIMTHDTRFKIQKACHQGCKDDRQKNRHLIGDGRQGWMNGAFQPVFIVHNSRL